MSLFPLFSGMIASSVHVLTGPDHLAAVTPFVIDENKKAWKVGLWWGVGHLSGMLVIGLLVYFFRELIPFETISAYSEQLVGVVLVGLGVWTLYKLFSKEKHHAHPHYHDQENKPYLHIHEHEHQEHANHIHKHQATHHRASVGIGFIHGLAGVSHFLLLLPVLSFESNLASGLYILGFGLGSLLSMIVYALVLGSLSSRVDSEHQPMMAAGIRLVAGLFALLLGIYWIIN